MAEEFGKMKCKTISLEMESFNNTFYFTSFEQRSEHHIYYTAQ